MNQPALPHRNESDPIEILLDVHLGGHAEDLAPSSGFLLAVMDSVQAEANEPPPIAFPWRRVIPGAVAILCGLVVLVVVWVRMNARLASHSGVPLTVIFRPNFTPVEAGIAWVLFAACLSVAAIATSFRITGRS